MSFLHFSPSDDPESTYLKWMEISKANGSEKEALEHLKPTDIENLVFAILELKKRSHTGISPQHSEIETNLLDRSFDIIQSSSASYSNILEGIFPKNVPVESTLSSGRIDNEFRQKTVQFLRQFYPITHSILQSTDPRVKFPEISALEEASPFIERSKNSYRASMERKIIGDVLKNYPIGSTIHYVGAGSGLLLEDWIILSQLILLGYRIDAHLVDNCYNISDKDTVYYPYKKADFLKAMTQFDDALKTLSPETSVKFYPSLEDAKIKADVLTGFAIQGEHFPALSSTAHPSILAPNGAAYFLWVPLCVAEVKTLDKPPEAPKADILLTPGLDQRILWTGESMIKKGQGIDPKSVYRLIDVNGAPTVVPPRFS